jgi:hypothetical protein
MLNTDNIQATEDNGYEFIMGERLKVLPQAIQGQLIDLQQYEHEWISTSSDPIHVRFRVIEYKGRKIIGTFSARRAEKDRMEREEKIRKAELVLRNPSQLKKKARYYFLKNLEGEKYIIDQDKIKQSEKYDGFLAIAYNAKNLTTEQVLDQYHHLYQIEHSFRTFKGYLETRLMFHWTDKRIAGHICLCYMAYSLLINLKMRLEKQGIPPSEDAIRSTLVKMQVSLIKQADNYFYLRSKTTEQTNHLLKVISVKPIPDLFPKQQIVKYL